MNLSAISSMQPAALSEMQHSTAASATSQSSSASLPNDTVSLSSTAQKAASSVDVDHDGDSH